MEKNVKVNSIYINLMQYCDHTNSHKSNIIISYYVILLIAYTKEGNKLQSTQVSVRETDVTVV